MCGVDRGRDGVGGDGVGQDDSGVEHEHPIHRKDTEDTLFTVGTPLGTNLDAYIDLPKDFHGDIERLRSRRGFDEGDTYRVLGSVSIASPAQLRLDSTDYPDWVVERYLQLPENLPTRVIDEAARVATGSTNPYDIALAYEAYLRTFEVDLTVPTTPARRDVVDYLLFDLRRGYFDYLSTAMTVMLRTHGVPARIAVGYALDPDDREGTTFSVRKNDAYSWVEVFFPSYGWIEFNPSGELLLGGNFRPSEQVSNGEYPEIPIGDPFLVEDLFNLPDLSPLGLLLEGRQQVGDGWAPWTLIWSLGGALLVIVLVTLGGRTYWVWGLRSLDGVPRQWAAIERLASWAGFQTPANESARQWGRRVGVELDHETAAVALSEAYEEARYGPPDLERIELNETSVPYQLLRNALLRHIFRLKSQRPLTTADEASPNTESREGGSAEP
mgnify:CR=1 FL=1